MTTYYIKAGIKMKGFPTYKEALEYSGDPDDIVVNILDFLKKKSEEFDYEEIAQTGAWWFSDKVDDVIEHWINELEGK